MADKRTKEDSRRYWAKQNARVGFREAVNRKQRERYRSHSQILARIKDVSCLDCGGHFHHSQMEFDHRPGTKKDLAIGRMKTAKLERLITEVEKCDIVCANCHALRTWNRCHGYE